MEGGAAPAGRPSPAEAAALGRAVAAAALLGPGHWGALVREVGAAQHTGMHIGDTHAERGRHRELCEIDTRAPCARGGASALQ